MTSYTAVNTPIKFHVMAQIAPIKIGLDPRLNSWAAEIKYVLRTLMRLAGYPYEFHAAPHDASPKDFDLYYGLSPKSASATVVIVACGRHFTGAPWLQPDRLDLSGGLTFLNFGQSKTEPLQSTDKTLHFSNDIIFACYWLLVGAPEPHYPRDQRDNLDLTGSFFIEQGLPTKPLVSQYAAFLRRHFADLGQTPLDLPWASAGPTAAVAFTHDVDYPQMIRWIECLRLLRSRGVGGTALMSKVVCGQSHFWQFDPWIELAKQYGTRPAFYFMARQGSLLEYALGTPDAFYDIGQPEFTDLFRRLTDDGCEVGLHASYHAHQDVRRIRCEKHALEQAAKVTVTGNRNHYWHLDPTMPHETLHRHEQAGLAYDSSLALEFYPGFRRGICHPFRPFHPGQRRELDLIELPPAWMDDHFDQRLAKNRIEDPVGYAKQLLDTARDTAGIVIVDYHVRGMNEDFFPAYGRWLRAFADEHLSSSDSFHTPAELARMYTQYEQQLTAHSRDLTDATTASARQAVTVTPDAQHADGAVCVGQLQIGEEDQWDAYANAHPRGNVYHTQAWRGVTEEGFGHRAYYLRAVDSEGKFVGILPLFLVDGLFGRRLVSVPMRDRGGVLADDADVASRLVGKAAELTRQLDCQYLELRSDSAPDQTVIRDHDLHCFHHWTTTRIDLTPGTDALWKGLDRKAIRWAINKARKQGIRIEQDDSLKGVRLFYEMFARTRHQMGIPPFSFHFFEAIWRHMISTGKANLFVIWKDRTPIHAMISLLSNDRFVPAYAAPQNEFRKLYPSELMIWHTIEWAAQHGFHTYDFGADSPQQFGLIWFKSKWGGRQHPMCYSYYLNKQEHPPNFDSSDTSFSLARAVWPRLPAAVSKHLGAWVTTQLS